MKTVLPKKRPPWLTLFLLAVTGLVFSGLSMELGNVRGIQGTSPLLYLLNTLPVLLILGFLWLLTGQAWLAGLVTGAAVFLLTYANYFKVQYRGEPVMWEDLHLLKEAGQMAGQYDVSPVPRMYVFMGVIAVLSLLLLLFGRGKPGLKVRLGSLAAVAAAGALCFFELFPDEDLYKNMAGEHAMSKLDSYFACGVVYPFFHSYGYYVGYLDGYSVKNALEVLDKYEDGVIPEDRKVSLVTVQLEAYTDFSLFDIEGISPTVYKNFHRVMEESYTGTLVTDIFAGGTTETEWAVLTGGNYHDDFAVKTDSVAWYMKDQGYVTGGGHPSHEWFYDRVHVNANLGLDNYLFMENHYNQYEDGDVAYDNSFFPDLEERIEEHFASSNAPMFSFNVTYQGHGPYNLERTYWGSSYCTGDYPDHISNALNHYLYLMQDTGNYAAHLVDYLDTLDEPVVLLLYGDHKPWMGINGSIYKELGINIDVNTEEGFLNYYSTWYAVWANEAAKEALGFDFEGEGPDLSPCFLMDHVFQLCGWEGSAYMQAQREVSSVLPVMHTTGWVKENGSYTAQPSEKARELIRQFQDVSIYDRTRWK
ncbi:MAG: sulfatase-like hydrolase/transferase [Ruminiclostridium sp.]|nr:sulfatase-like hydrolase/transferase [Ruminiclostridium sp.]